jgi:hypothetical protein
MTNLRLVIAIIVPMLFNGALIDLLYNNVSACFASIEARLDILTGKVALPLRSVLARRDPL